MKVLDERLIGRYLLKILFILKQEKLLVARDDIYEILNNS